MSTKTDRMRLVVVGVVAAMVVGSGNAKADFVVCDPRPVDEAINSPGALHPSGCSFLHDGLKLYFTSGRDPSNTNSRELWVSERKSPDAHWGEAVNLGPNINQPTANESGPAISPDDLELYFKQSGGGTHWMRSTRATKDDPWGPAADFTAFGGGLDFASDGLSVYYGDGDIWVATRATTDDEWGEAVNLGPNVNDSDWQVSPSISNDGLALFFLDYTTHRIFMCIRATTNDGWGPRMDVGPAVNDHGVKAPEISPDGSTLYFSAKWLYMQVSIKPVVDFDDNGSVGMSDLLAMIGAWGTDERLCDIGPMPWGDGVVNEADLEVLMEHWGEIPVYMIVDDFEGYDVGENEIWFSWKDGLGYAAGDTEPGYPGNGTGSAVGNETTASFTEEIVVHGGFQSMPFFYDNSTALTSEATREWEEPQDWTRRGVESLTLWYHGDLTNDPEPMYVVLQDSADNSAAVMHPDFAVTTTGTWQEWSIALKDFTGVDLQSIKKMSIGIGDRASTDPGGSGVMYIDDIGLDLPSKQ